MNGSAITREILANIPVWLVGAFYALAFVACGWAALVLIRRSSARHRARHPAQSPLALGERLLSIARYLVFQEPLRRDRFAGIAHLLSVYGFFILIVGTAIVFFEHQTPLHFFYGWFYRIASLVIDLGGLALIVGLLMFLWRRHFGREERILQAWWVAALAWLLLVIAISGFALEATRIAVELPHFECWSAVGYVIALALHAADVNAEALQLWHRAFWGRPRARLHLVFCTHSVALLCPHGLRRRELVAAQTLAARPIANARVTRGGTRSRDGSSPRLERPAAGGCLYDVWALQRRLSSRRGRKTAATARNCSRDSRGADGCRKRYRCRRPAGPIRF